MLETGMLERDFRNRDFLPNILVKRLQPAWQPRVLTGLSDTAGPHLRHPFASIPLRKQTP